MTHETWCATHDGGGCDCTYPDGHPFKARHEADKAFTRGVVWDEEATSRMREAPRTAWTPNRIGPGAVEL